MKHDSTNLTVCGVNRASKLIRKRYALKSPGFLKSNLRKLYLVHKANAKKLAKVAKDKKVEKKKWNWSIKPLWIKFFFN